MINLLPERGETKEPEISFALFVNGNASSFSAGEK